MGIDPFQSMFSVEKCNFFIQIRLGRLGAGLKIYKGNSAAQDFLNRIFI